MWGHIDHRILSFHIYLYNFGAYNRVLKHKNDKLTFLIRPE
jgi:hypothetical protein